jgi:sugar lactone lactonase YvrE
MKKALKILLTAALAIMACGAAQAQHVCAYVNDNGSAPNTVEGYKIGPGAATAHVGPFATNGNGSGANFFFFSGSLAAARVPQGDLYVGDSASNNVTHFTVNKTNCALTLDRALYPSGDTSVRYGDGLAITPDGNTMFVAATGDDHIYSHAISSNGSLGATYTEAATPEPPNGIAVSSDGKTLIARFLYLAEVCAYPIAGGHLGASNCQSMASFPTGIAIDPVSKCVYASVDTAEVTAFTLTESVLGVATVNAFGPQGSSSDYILVNSNNKALYVANPGTAQLAIGTIAPGCKVNFKALISDGLDGADNPAQIAQAKTTPSYVVTGDSNSNEMPSMGIFHALPNGNLIPIGSGQYPLMRGSIPTTIVVVDSH